MKLLKQLARRILKDELEADSELIERLRGYARPHIPKLEPDGTDQTYNLQYKIDVDCFAHFPSGNIRTNNVVTLGSLSRTKGE